MDSILNTIKKMIGGYEGSTDFDTDLIIHINTALSVLTQLGVGPIEGFSIIDDSATWNEFFGNYRALEFVKSYVYMKVRMLFDPPSSSAAMDAMNRQLSELEWRIQVAVDND